MDKNTIIAAFDTLNLDDLEAIKTELAEKIKARKESAKAAEAEAKAASKVRKVEEVKAGLAEHKYKVGDKIRFEMLGKVWTSTIEKITDKSFTVDVGEVEGKKTTKRYIKFDKVLGLAE